MEIIDKNTSFEATTADSRREMPKTEAIEKKNECSRNPDDSQSFNDTLDQAYDDECSDSDKTFSDTGNLESFGRNDAGEDLPADKEFDGSLNEAIDKETEVRQIKCIHEDLEGQTHPETGVPYERQRIEVNGETVEGVFPKFKSEYDVQLPKEEYLDRDYKQKETCNKDLAEGCKRDPEVRSKFSEDQMEQINAGMVPDGYVWHHNQEPGKMELVDDKIHGATRHTGGKCIWGGER